MKRKALGRLDDITRKNKLIKPITISNPSKKKGVPKTLTLIPNALKPPPVGVIGVIPQEKGFIEECRG